MSDIRLDMGYFHYVDCWDDNNTIHFTLKNRNKEMEDRQTYSNGMLREALPPLIEVCFSMDIHLAQHLRNIINEHMISIDP